MAPEILTSTHGSFYVPMDGPWCSEEDNEAYKLAEEKYNELINDGLMYVSLIRSHCDSTHGYWIETRKSKVTYPDYILKKHDTCAQE